MPLPPRSSRTRVSDALITHAPPGIPSSFITLLVNIGPASVVEAGGVLGMIIVCALLTWLTMLAADRLGRLRGRTGADAVGRISDALGWPRGRATSRALTLLAPSRSRTDVEL
jgi:hypothetical protein